MIATKGDAATSDVRPEAAVVDDKVDAAAGTSAVACRPGRRERLVLLSCVVAILVYLALAYFVFVRPGVNRLDHVLAVLLPSLLLAGIVDFWPRMRAGLRASVALLVGVVAIVAGAVAVDRLIVEGFRASAICGLLPLVAGAVLVVLGAWLSWVSRKRGGSFWRMAVRRVLVAVAALLVVYWVVIPVSMAIIATERPSNSVRPADLGRPYEDVTLVTRDGLKLSAWYVPSRNTAAVVAFPRAWTLRQARALAEHGYGVLLVDPRGYGGSQGDPNAYGWGSTRDIDAAVAWLRRRPGVQNLRIGGLGLSMGGEQMIETAARNASLQAVVSEGAGIRSIREALLPRGVSSVELALRYPQELVLTASVWLLGSQPVPISLKSASTLIAPRAVFFIYGEDGQESERGVNPVYYDAAYRPKAIWQVPGAGHTQGIVTQPGEYERRVIAFFDRALLGEK